MHVLKRIGNRADTGRVHPQLRSPGILALCMHGTEVRLKGHRRKVAALDDAVAAFNPTDRIKGKTIIRVHP